MGRIRHVFPLLTCVLIVGLLTGCATQGKPSAAEMDVRKLDVGKYAVDRHSYGAAAPGQGPILEGMRMSRALAPAIRIDPSLRYGDGSRVVRDSADATDHHLLAAVSKPVLDRDRMVVGYVGSGSDKPDTADKSATVVTDVMLRFPDESTAHQAAKDLEDADFGVAPDVNRKLSVPAYPDAYVHYRPGVPSVGAFLAYKQFVISLYIQRPKSEEADLQDWVRKSYDAEVAALKGFQPTEMNALDSLPVDPGGLLARAVVAQRDQRAPDPDVFAVYGSPAFVSTSSDEAARQRLVDDTGNDAIAVADTSSVLRVRDAAAGTRLLDGLAASAGQPYAPADPPKNIPGAKCVSSSKPLGDSIFRCYVGYGRYVEVVTAPDRADADHRAAAAYALLANSL